MPDLLGMLRTGISIYNLIKDLRIKRNSLMMRYELYVGCIGSYDQLRIIANHINSHEELLIFSKEIISFSRMRGIKHDLLFDFLYHIADILHVYDRYRFSLYVLHLSIPFIKNEYNRIRYYLSQSHFLSHINQIDNAYKSAMIARTNKYPVLNAEVLFRISEITYVRGKLEAAKTLSEECIDYILKYNLESGICYAHVLRLYSKILPKLQYKPSDSFLKKARQKYLSYLTARGRVWHFTNMADYYRMKFGNSYKDEDYEISLHYALKSKNESEKLENINRVAHSQLILSYLYIISNQHNELVDKYLEDSFSIYNSLNSYGSMLETKALEYEMWRQSKRNRLRSMKMDDINFEIVHLVKKLDLLYGNDCRKDIINFINNNGQFILYLY